MTDFNREVSQVRREFSKNFLIFRQTYFKRYHKYPDAKFHKALSGFLWKMTKVRGAKLALAAPRESAKSTIISLEYAIYCICHKTEPYILLISSTSDQASALLMDVKLELEQNMLLREDFPEVFPIGKPRQTRWREDEIIAANGVKMTALGTAQQARGRKHKEERPSLIIGDDMEKGENTQTHQSADKLYNWFTKSILRSGSNTTNVILAGTIHHYDSFLARFLAEEKHPEWKKAVYKSIRTWSARVDLWSTWTKVYHSQEDFNGEKGPMAARKFFEQNQEEMLDGTEVFWPEQRNYYDLMVIREQDYSSFDSELQNEPINPQDCDFNMNEVIFWDDDGRFRTVDALMRFLGRNVEFFGACDPSIGKENKKGDFSAIVTIARDTRDGTLYLVDADILRRSPDMTIDTIISYGRIRDYTRFAIETNQFQILMANELERRSSAAGVYLKIEQITNSKSKIARIRGIQPFVRSGRLQFSQKHKPLLDQIRTFPVGAHDDGLDALEMAIRMCTDSQYVEPKIHVIRTGAGFGGIRRVDHIGL